MSKLLKSIMKRNNLVSESIQPKTATPAARPKELDILYGEVNGLIESAARESLKNVIMESSMPDTQKLSTLSAVDKPLTESEVNYFITSTIDPILETVGNINNGKVLKSTNKNLRGVNLIVYEIAQTLESARLGALTLESLEDKAISSDPGPITEEVEAFADQVAPGPITDENGAVAKSPDEDATGLGDLVKTTLDPTYNFGDNLKEGSVADLLDPFQNDNFDNKPVDQAYRHADEPDFKTDANIEPYEGEVAADPANGLFDKPMVESYKRLSRYLHSLREDVETGETDGTTEVEPDFETAESIKPYEGEEAGKPPYEATGAELQPAGTAEELAEQQVTIAKYLITRIFNEYGVKDNKMKKKLVKESMHYLFRYGMTNLIPAYSDVAHLVTDQNALSESGHGKPSNDVIAITTPKMSKGAAKALKENTNELITAIVNAHTLANRGLVKEANIVREAVITTLKANEVERQRQATRYRMSRFSEHSKQYTLSNWVLVENTNPNAAKIEKEINIKLFVTEGENLNAHLKTLNENSPLFKPEIKKRNLNNDALTTASIVTEVAMTWTKLKKSIYNNAPMEYKFIALESMLQTLKGYKNLCTAMGKPAKVTSVLESFEYRLTGLKDKVLAKLNG